MDMEMMDQVIVETTPEVIMTGIAARGGKESLIFSAVVGASAVGGAFLWEFGVKPAMGKIKAFFKTRKGKAKGESDQGSVIKADKGEMAFIAVETVMPGHSIVK